MFHALISIWHWLDTNGVGQNLLASPIWAAIAYCSHRTMKTYLNFHHDEIKSTLEEHHAKLDELVNKSDTKETPQATEEY